MNLEIKPFYLYFNCKEPHLDPVHHLLRWIYESRLTNGPLFRKLDAQDRVIEVESKGLVRNFAIFESYFRLQSSSWIF